VETMDNAIDAPQDTVGGVLSHTLRFDG